MIVKATKKIVITGPESTGKSTLANRLGEELNAPVVPEFARYYIDQLNRPYNESDLRKIAKGQVAAEDLVIKSDSPFIICDTDLITIQIWAEEKYNRCDPWILRTIKERHYDAYILCRPTLGWIADPQRENPMDRGRLYEVYEKKLRGYGKRYLEVDLTREGTGEVIVDWIVDGY